MKKLLLVLMAIVVCVPLAFCFGCSTEDKQIESADGIWKYLENDDGTITLTTVRVMSENMVIPSVVDGKTVSAFGEKLFVNINDGSESKKLKDVYDDNKVLKTIVIEAQITEIPNMCFYLCKNLISITFPETLESVKDFVFYGCSSLERIEFPEKCTSIGGYSFRECTSLKNVVFNASVIPNIGDKCFYNVNPKASDDDQYIIIEGLNIIVKDKSLYELDKLEALRKETRNNSYKYWKEYVEAGIVKDSEIA